jgi:hypothetical protein
MPGCRRRSTAVSQILYDITDMILNGRWGEAAQSVEMGQALRLKVRTIRLNLKVRRIQ